MATSEDNKSTVLEAEESLVKAMLDSDLNLLASLLHHNMRFAIPTGDVITKAVELDNYESGKMLVSEVSIQSREITEVGDHSIVSAITLLKGSFAGNRIEGKFKFIRIWEMTKDGPQVVAGSSTPMT